MEERTKRRLVGATILVSAFVIVAPALLDHAGTDPAHLWGTPPPPPPTGLFPGRLSDLAAPPPELAESPQEDLPEPVPFEEPPPEAGNEGPPEPEALLGAPQPARAPGPVGGGNAEGPVAPAPTPGPTADGEAQRPDDNARVGLSAWAVQLSTFANAANAISLRNALRGRGFVAFVESTPEKATRVYVGPELQREKAVAAQQRLARDLGIKGAVVPYPGSRPP